MQPPTRFPATRLAAACLLAAAACDDPTATRTPPAAPRQLVIQAILDPDRTIQHVHVEPLSPAQTLANVMGRLYEDGALVETDGVAAHDPFDPRLQRCAGTFGGALETESGVCLEFDYWPRAESEYRVEVRADGFESAAGSATIPSYFDFTSHDIRGTPPGTEGLDLSWTASDGAEMYVVTVAAGSTGWRTETDQLAVSTVVPRQALADGGDEWLVQVRALERGLYEYFTTGAEGDFFPVPPAQNVEGGYGVVGAWINRAIIRGLIEAVVRRGDWNVTARPLPTADFSPGQAMGSRAGALYVPDTGSQRLFRWSSDDDGWTTVFDGLIDPGALATTERGVVAQNPRPGGVDILLFEDTASAPRVVTTLEGTVNAAFIDHTEGLWLLTWWSDPGSPTIMLRSTDDGATFDTVTLPLAAALEAGIDDIAESPVDGALYAPVSTGRPDAAARPVVRSTDRGATWEVVTGTLPGDAAQIEAGADGRLYIGIHQVSPGIYVSDDGGSTWTRTFFERVRELVAHPTQPGRVWFSSLRNFLDGAPGGVFESVDGGLSFTSLALENAQTLGLVHDPTYDRLYTVERSRGVLVLDLD